MTSRDKKFRDARRQVLHTQTRIKQDTFGEIDRLLTASLERIQATLAAQPSDYQQWSLSQLQRTVRASLDEWRVGTADSIGGGLERSWETGKLMVDEPLAAGGIQLHGIIQTIDTRQLIAMREFMTDRISDISLQAVNRINTELGHVLTGTQAPADAIGNIARILNSRSRNRALTIVRTELGRAFSTANQARKMQARHIAPGLKKQWRRSGKVHSRIAHDAADGQVREVDEPYLIGGHRLMFPRDPKAPASETINCGCESLPHMEHWDTLNPGRQPFSDEELARNVFKRNLQHELSGRTGAA